MTGLNLTVDVKNVRLDKYLSDEIEILSRSKIRECIVKKLVSVNDQPVKPSYLLKGGEVVSIEFPEPDSGELMPEPIPLEVIFEDDEIAIINKPPGLVVHPAAGVPNGTLVNGLIYHFKNLSTVNGRPGIVHRLDKNTSGVMVIAKNDDCHMKISNQFRNRTIHKIYHALVFGHFHLKDGIINFPISRNPVRRKQYVVDEHGRDSLTLYSVIEEYEELSLVELNPKSGRTHQIRVHLKSIGHPVFADDLYEGGISRINGYSGKKNKWLTNLYRNINRQALHALSLSINHPVSGERMTFNVPLQSDFKTIIDLLERKNG